MTPADVLQLLRAALPNPLDVESLTPGEPDRILCSPHGSDMVYVVTVTGPFHMSRPGDITRLATGLRLVLEDGEETEEVQPIAAEATSATLTDPCTQRTPGVTEGKPRGSTG